MSLYPSSYCNGRFIASFHGFYSVTGVSSSALIFFLFLHSDNLIFLCVYALHFPSVMFIYTASYFKKDLKTYEIWKNSISFNCLQQASLCLTPAQCTWKLAFQPRADAQLYLTSESSQDLPVVPTA